jgi:hypothetical protein
MPEWLRGLTRNQLGFACARSNRARDEIGLLFSSSLFFIPAVGNLFFFSVLLFSLFLSLLCACTRQAEEEQVRSNLVYESGLSYPITASFGFLENSKNKYLSEKKKLART